MMNWSAILNDLEDKIPPERWKNKVELLERLADLGVPQENRLEGRAVTVLRCLATDSKWEVRRAVADVLPNFPHAKIQGVLEILSADPNKWVKESARLARKKLRVSENIDKRDRKYDEVLRLVRQLKRKYPEEMSDELMDDVLKVAFKTGEKYYEELASEAVHQTKTVRLALADAVESLDAELAKRVFSRRRSHALLADISQERDNLVEIFKVLMEYSRPWDAPVSQENLASVVEEALDHAKDHARGTNPNRIHVTMQLDRGLQIEANKTALTQAVRNIIVNAMESMPRGGKLSITVASGYQGTAFVIISDTGNGMTPEELEGYKRPGTSSKKDEKHWRTGFGLPFALKIIELGHNGKVLWDTAPKRGTKVTLELPLHREEYQ